MEKRRIIAVGQISPVPLVYIQKETRKTGEKSCANDEKVFDDFSKRACAYSVNVFLAMRVLIIRSLKCVLCSRTLTLVAHTTRLSAFPAIPYPPLCSRLATTFLRLRSRALLFLGPNRVALSRAPHEVYIQCFTNDCRL